MEHRAHSSGGNELGDFLYARRAALDPRQAGFPDDGRLRRVPGLRREELAQLAHVSVDYVVRLEQGRVRRVSRPVLDALADALQLAPDERAYLFTVADVPQTAPTRRPAGRRVDPRLRQLLDGMHDIPAMIVHRRMDVLAWNSAAAALLTDFRTWWSTHQVRGPRQLTKTYHHPVAGALTLDVQQLSVDTQPDQLLVAYTAAPDSPSHEALRFLLQWSAHTTGRQDHHSEERDGRR
jgi:transcriptional regulator with XRE-family HTH domain